jgi:hypothetical protein
MCWTGDIKHKRIATEDICCKKIISTSDDKMLRAWFRRNHVYHIGETYTARISPLPSTVGETRLIIRNGLHCYDNKVGITSVDMNNCEPPYLVVKRLFHGLREFYHPFFERMGPVEVRPVIVECIIPKGTVFYENEWGDIVAETLKIIKIIKPD